MPTITEQLASLSAEIVGVKNKADAVAAAATTKIAELGTTYQTLIATLSTTVYVNQTTGLDTNAGTALAPIKTLQRAVAMTPRGGKCRTLLQTNYLLDADLSLDQRALFIESDSGVKRRLTFDQASEIISAVETRYRRQFILSGFATLHFYGLTVVEPTANNPALATDYRRNMIRNSFWGYHSLNAIGISGCDIEIPAANPFGWFMNAASPMSLMVSANTITTATVAGRWFEGITAGTASTTLPWLITNLATL